MLYGREIIHNVQLSILNVRLCKTPSPDGLHHFYQCNPINFAREKFPGEIIRKIIHWKAGKSWYFYNGQNRWKTNTYNPLFKKRTQQIKENNYLNNNFSIYLYKIQIIIFEFRNKFLNFSL